MLTKLQQRSWIKIEVARCRSTQECLRNCVKHVAMQRCQMARWRKAFRGDRDAVQDNLRTERPQVENNTVELLASLLDTDH